MPYQIKNIPMLQKSGDPLLGALGAVAGTAIGNAVGGPIGGSIGGSLGAQLGGQGTVDLEKTATDTAMSAGMGAAMGAATDAVAQGAQQLKVGSQYGLDPLSEQAKMLAEQEREFGIFSLASGGQIPYASSNIPGGQGLQTGLVDDAAMGIAYAPPIAQLASPLSAIFGGAYVDNKIDKLGESMNKLKQPTTGTLISDASGNVRSLDDGQMDAYNALNKDPLQGLQGFGNRPEAEAVAKHGFGSPQHFAQAEAQQREVRTGTNNVSGDATTNVVRTSSGAPLRNSRDGSVVANANQPSTDSGGSTGGK